MSLRECIRAVCARAERFGIWLILVNSTHIHIYIYDTSHTITMLRSALGNLREYLSPISHKSTFFETGQITPDEFVQAGDYLVNMFPTWSWSGTDGRRCDINYRTFLPNDKQFLVSKRVPSVQRVHDLFSTSEECYLLGDGDSDSENSKEKKDKYGRSPSGIPGDVAPVESGVQPLNDQLVTNQSKPADTSKNSPNNDIDAMLESLELDNFSLVNGNDNYNYNGEDDDDDDEILVDSNITAQNSKRRYYDLYIAYSTSYRVPKMYLVGYSAQGTPLSPKEMFEDIATDYRNKTATIQKLPFYKTSFLSVSIHPCKHANVMKVLLERARLAKRRKRLEEKEKENGGVAKESEVKEVKEEDWEDLEQDVDDTLRVDQYLVIFLKFIASVTPSIEHDYTMEGW